jgi:hypothetical protein
MINSNGTEINDNTLHNTLLYVNDQVLIHLLDSDDDLQRSVNTLYNTT